MFTHTPAIALLNGWAPVWRVANLVQVTHMTRFDIDNLQDPALRIEFGNIQNRADSIARSVMTAYGSGKEPIIFKFIDGQEFNAFARRDRDTFIIELNAAVPLFLQILFTRLLSDKNVLPFLDDTGPAASSFGLPFIIDPADFERRVDWRCELNAIRAFAASTMADICATFVICHEFGHVMSGHVEAASTFEKTQTVAELVSLTRTSKTVAARRQAWEYDADFIAASLLIHFVAELVKDCDINERTRAVFARPDGGAFEHTLAITFASLFAFFTYVQGMRRQLQKGSAHPHPIVRAHYLKTMLLRASGEQRTMSDEDLEALLDVRLNEMMGALETLGLFDSGVYSEQYVADIDAELDRLLRLQKTHRSDCARWSWISWG